MGPSAASPHVLGSLLYFFLFLARGSITPFMPLVWQSKGLSQHQIGLVSATRPVIKFFATPVVCAFADRHSIQQQVLYASLLLYAATRTSVLFAGSFLAVMVVETSCSVGGSPIGGLIDSAIRNAFGSDGYGMLRLWGAVGYGIASLLGGYISDSHDGSYTVVMVIFVANILLALIASTNVRVGRQSKDESDSKTKNEINSINNNINPGGDARSGDEQPVGDNDNRVAAKGCGIGAMGITLPPQTSGDILVTRRQANSESAGSNLKVSADASGTLASNTAAAADNALDCYNDDDGDDDESDEEAQAQTNDALLPKSLRLSSGRGKEVPARNDSEECTRLQEANEQAKPKGGVLMAVRIMLGTDQSASFFMAVGLSGMGSGVIDTFLFIRLQELGGSHVLCGLARLIMCMAEVPFFYLSGPLIRRLGARGVIILAQAAYLARFIYYATLRDPWWVLPSEVLHGLTYAAMWAATIDYAHGVAPAHLRTTIQGAVSGLHWGLGSGLGGMLGGVLYAGLGAQRCFAVSAALPSLALLLMVVLPTARQCCRGNASCRGGRWGRSGIWAAGVTDGARGGRSADIDHGDKDSSYELVAVEKGSLIKPSERTVSDNGDSGIDVELVDRTYHRSNSGSSVSDKVDYVDLERQRREAALL